MYDINFIGEYYKTLTGENCPKNSIITTEAECEHASSKIGLTWGGKPTANKEHPYGCYWARKNDKTRFDENAKPSNIDLTFPGAAGICKRLAGNLFQTLFQAFP